MSQADLAELLGNQQTSISKLENGSKRITVAELSQILCACGLTFGVVSNDLDSLFMHESQPLWERVNE
jgi:DNA-binding helix-turn-helix protein